MDVQQAIRYETAGLPKDDDTAVPWLLRTLDPSAILSRTLVKTAELAWEPLVRNIQRHEAKRGRQFAHFYERMVESVGLDLDGSRILEVGAGPGGVCLGLHEIGGKVVSIDLIDGRVFYDKEVPFLQASGTVLPFKDGSFDFLSLTSVLHHLPVVYRDVMLEEASRVADVLLIQEDCLSGGLGDRLMRLVDDGVSGEIGTHQAESHMTKDEWLKYFADHDLDVLADFDHHPTWMGVGMQKTFFVVRKTS